VGGVGPRYSRPRPISQDDDTSQFSCGDEVYDRWLQRFALPNHFGGGARTYVTLLGAQVVGYYALAAASIQHADVTHRVAHGMPRPVPAVLLARLAIDQKEQHRGLGSHLVRDAITRTVEAAEIVGIRILLVHADTDALCGFYQGLDFERSPTNPMHLMLLLKDAKAIITRS
jgi:ribosomal protein S18 acetylase RimI-like enzyme